MGVNGYTKYTLGVRKLKMMTASQIPKKQKHKLIRLFQQIVLKTEHAFLPKDPETLVMESMTEFVPEGRIEAGFLKALMACKKGSVEKRLVRALVLGCVEGEEGRNMIARDFVNARGIMKLSRTNVSEAAALEGDDDAVSQLSLSKTRKWSGNFRSLYSKAEEDWNHLIKSGYICKRHRRRLSVPEETITEVVSFILQPANR